MTFAIPVQYCSTDQHPDGLMAQSRVTAIISNKFISFSAVQIHDLSYIHLHTHGRRSVFLSGGGGEGGENERRRREFVGGSPPENFEI